MSFILFGLSCRRAPILYLQVRYRFSVFVEDSEASAAAAAAANFGGLVLCCMDSYDSEKRRIFQHFSQSTQICNWIWEIVQAFAPIFKISPKFPDFLQNFANFHSFSPFRHFSAQISRIFPGISQDARELLKVFGFCGFFWNFIESWVKKCAKAAKQLRSSLCQAPQLTGLPKKRSAAAGRRAVQLGGSGPFGPSW